MTVDAVIANSHVVLPHGVVDKNVVIDEGKIVDITTDIPTCDCVINGAGLVSVPGPIDPHVHYGVYSSVDKAARTESHVAAIGGITTMMRMLRLGGAFSTDLKLQLNASRSTHYVDYTAHASIFNDQHISEMDYCTKNGITSFKLYMNLGGEVGHVYMDMQPYTTELQDSKVCVTDEIIEKTISKASELKCPVLVHAEDYEACACGIKTAKKEKQDGLTAWSKSRSQEYEAKAIKKICRHARKYNCAIYFVHIGSRAALEQIRIERKLGTKIHVESCPHYMILNHENRHDYLAKVMPPIRTNADNRSVWGAISQNHINTIGTDHVANRLELKVGSDVWESLAGFPGIGVMIPILVSEGINRNRMSLEHFTRLTSMNTAKIFSMYPDKGSLEIGTDADITMLDLKLKRKVTSDMFGGFSDYTPYDGLILRGWPVRTIVRGVIVAEDFEVVTRPGHGKFISRTLRPSINKKCA